MLTPLLATKLFIPPARPNRVPRPRLIEQLMVLRPLTLVAAPAGFGKTTLLSDWIPKSKHCVTWLSLDEGDNDPIRFWVYVIAALQKLRTDLGEDALALLKSPQLPPITAILSTLINEIVSFPEDFFIVLDDYHLIKTQSIHEALTFLLDHLPAQMHIILTTRADPPLPVARLRTRNQLTELRADDLRFTSDEAAMFLNEVMGLRLSADDIAVLESRTEGWIAGLQLAALSMQDRDDLTGFIKAFSGGHRHVLTYLAEEVLEHCPEGTLDFLLLTSILDQLCGPLCDAVTEGNDSQALLQKLEQANLFIVPLDIEEKWFRYHHLFADVLRARLQQTQSNLMPVLHRRASAWYEQNGLIAEAVNHALAAQEWERAAQLLTLIVNQIVGMDTLAGQAQSILRWLTALPAAVVRTNPTFCFYHATVLMFTGQLGEAEAWLDSAERTVQLNTPLDAARATLGWVALLRADIARGRGDLASGIVLARRALELLPGTEASGRAVAQLNLAHAYLATGDVTQSAECIAEDAIAKLRGMGNLFATMIAITNLARLQALQGRCHQAAATFALAEHVAPGGGRLQDLLNGAAFYIGLGDLLREWNELEGAHQQLTRGMELVRGMLSVDADVVAMAYVAFAKLRQASGDLSGALHLLDEFAQLGRERGFFAPVVARGEAIRIQLCLSGEYLGDAILWAEKSGLHSDDNELSYLREIEYLTLVRVFIAQHRMEDALRLLANMLPTAEAGGRKGRVIEILMLRALALRVNHLSAEALGALTSALVLAEPEGYVRTFLDEGESMREAIRYWRLMTGRNKVLTGQQTRLMAYTDRLLQAFLNNSPQLPNTNQPANSPILQASLVDPLSRRELEVLHLIAEGLSNLAIAQKLFLSTGTVKVHLKHIYGKLNVNSRTQAVARIHELNLR